MSFGHVGTSYDDEGDVEETCYDGDEWAFLHPYQGAGGVVEFFKGEVEFAEVGVDAGEFSVCDSEAVLADAFLWNACEEITHGLLWFGNYLFMVACSKSYFIFVC